MKITIYVEEKIQHKVVMLALDDEATTTLLDDLDSDNKDEFAGDLTDGINTAQDGEFELQYYDIEDAED